MNADVLSNLFNPGDQAAAALARLAATVNAIADRLQERTGYVPATALPAAVLMPAAARRTPQKAGPRKGKQALAGK